MTLFFYFSSFVFCGFTNSRERLSCLILDLGFGAWFEAVVLDSCIIAYIDLLFLLSFHFSLNI